MHFTGGEIIPSRVLCPWRARLLASTLPAVARATAACFVRCEWMIGRGLGLLRGSSSGWCVRCQGSFPKYSIGPGPAQKGTLAITPSSVRPS